MGGGGRFPGTAPSSGLLKTLLQGYGDRSLQRQRSTRGVTRRKGEGSTQTQTRKSQTARSFLS
ncbi:Hypothetical predicted protein, partial [Podarcis lilfordi]